MPSWRCVVQDCSNISDILAGLSLHKRPIENIARGIWVKFVRTKRANFNPGEVRFMVCSDHFSAECFERSYHMKGTTRRLKQGSVPSIWKKTTGCSRIHFSFFPSSYSNILLRHCCISIQHRHSGFTSFTSRVDSPTFLCHILGQFANVFNRSYNMFADNLIPVWSVYRCKSVNIPFEHILRIYIFLTRTYWFLFFNNFGNTLGMNFRYIHLKRKHHF